MTAPLVGIVMGSDSDWETMQHASRRLAEFGVPHERRVVSAHRMPDCCSATPRRRASRGLRCIIAGAGGAAHLPGMLAAKTTVPVLGVPVPAATCRDWTRCSRSCRCPPGIPVATFAIGAAGAPNAALFAVAMLALDRPGAAARLRGVPRRADRTGRSALELSGGSSDPAPARPSACSAAASSAGCSRCARARWATAWSCSTPTPAARPARSPTGTSKPPTTTSRPSIELAARVRRGHDRVRERARGDARARWPGPGPSGPPVEAVAIAQDRIAEKNFTPGSRVRHAPRSIRCATQSDLRRRARRRCGSPPSSRPPAGLRRQGPGARSPTRPPPGRRSSASAA